MINDPLAADLDKEANHNLNTEIAKRAEEIKNGIAEVSEDDSDLESKLNKLKDQSDDDIGSSVMRQPMVATHPNEAASAQANGHVEIPNPAPPVEAVANVASNPPAAQDGEAMLKATFPDLDEDQIKTFYEISGNNFQQAKQLINQQLGIFTEEDEAPGVDPNDVEFNLLAGQMDPNAISEEERKMIEQALRESAPQAQPNQIPQGVHAVNRRQINQARQQQQRMEAQLPDEEVVNNLEERKKNAKNPGKVKKGGNQCCIIF